jgi:hypothetical protein
MMKRQNVIAMALLAMVISACGYLDTFRADMSDCEQVGVRYSPPEYVTVVEESCGAGSGPGNAAYRATLTFPGIELGNFQATTGLTDYVTDTSAADIFTDEAAGLGSGLVAHYGDGAYLREVLIDTSDPDTYRAYYYHAYVD